MIHQPLSPDGVHPPNQFIPEIVSPLPCSFGLVCHILLFVYFFKELILSLTSLTLPYQHFQCFDSSRD